MPDLKDINNIYMVIAFIMPGAIITYIRSQFISGKIEKISDAAFGYLALTIVYYGFSLPAIVYILETPQGWIKFALWWALIIVGPSAFGLILGVAAQHQWIRWIARRLNLRIIHGTPTSWDWRFASCSTERFVIVTLVDGSSVFGIFGTQSFASSDPSERDLYIQEVMDVSEDGAWAYRAEVAGILILAKEIRFVEFKGPL